MKDMRINQTEENQKQKTNIPKGWAEVGFHGGSNS